ncbi:hypothetical protein TRAPUB_2251 [Trametes pubescens]|uniref:Uncharacterized protein n=1 Tax=Trametes pubescens TaxID=154538 RepID=A0A1M2VH21_TRAPU|nr:hypothetical protein TRAPUB_2251 [Trametes pubescens]
MLDDLVQQYSADHILVAKTDVTQRQDVLQAFALAKSAFGHIDVVFNNTRYAGLGEAESVEDADAHALLATNFWGAVSVTREAIKFFRESNPPGVAVASSRCHPCLASLAHPVWLSTLRRNMITILEPGFFQTEVANVARWSPAHPAYLKPTLPSSAMRAEWDSFVLSGDPTKAAEAFYRAATLPDPPLHLILGRDAIGLAKKMAAVLQDTAARFEHWSDDLELTSENGTA